ncbi:hypothetical protein DL95DRAFT_471568 [Leptodontidium sp. 2 PMI_412]|nr:hypothetical protein DL95DRAFT_471568 [Leptodontidium sp. 2 PMI_412]
MTPTPSNHDDPSSAPSRLMFTLCNRLPIELRLKIWKDALPDPRVVNVREKRLRKTRRDHDKVAVTSGTKGPSVLFACPESYSVASKFYIPSETMDELECLYDSANLKRVQNLAVLLNPDPDQITNIARPDRLANILFLFGHVKNLTLILGHFDQEGDD